jgi:uncharacterized protein YbaA (DUF1428 family)
MAKGGYVDGFVLAVPKKNTAAYKKMAKEAAVMWKKFGALDYKECVGEDLKPKGAISGGINFPKIAGVKTGETVWFSFITYKSRAHRDAVNKKVMAYFQKKYADKDMANMPFDMKRMAYGGFKVEVSS